MEKQIKKVIKMMIDGIEETKDCDKGVSLEFSFNDAVIGLCKYLEEYNKIKSKEKKHV